MTKSRIIREKASQFNYSACYVHVLVEIMMIVCPGVG